MANSKLGQGFVAAIRITCSWHYCKQKLTIPWENKLKGEFNQPRYERVLNCKYYKMLRSPNNWIIMSFIDKVTDYVEYKQININILDGNVSNT